MLYSCIIILLCILYSQEEWMNTNEWCLTIYYIIILMQNGLVLAVLTKFVNQNNCLNYSFGCVTIKTKIIRFCRSKQVEGILLRLFCDAILYKSTLKNKILRKKNTSRNLWNFVIIRRHNNVVSSRLVSNSYIYIQYKTI